MSKIIFVEDQTTAENLQRGVDPELITFAHPRGLRTAKRFDEVYVRYPSPNWFHSTGMDPVQFQTWMREYASSLMKRGGDFQQI